MAIQIPIITSLEDAGIKAAKAAFNNFKHEVGNAEGAMGKFKAGSKAALDTVKANAATFAIAAGASIATFSFKAVSKFNEVALAAGELADATGLTVEEASRLAEVAGDIGIEAGALETGIGKMNKVLGKSPELFKELGVEVAYAKDGSVDANETFLNTIDRLNAIKDPAERARVASELLGKGWQSMAELIAGGSDKLRASLAGVSESKVIDKEELDRARKYRENMDRLKDSFDDFAISLGEGLIPVLITSLGFLGDLVELVDKAVHPTDPIIPKIAPDLMDQVAAANAAKDAWKGYTDARIRATEDTSKVVENIGAVTDATYDLNIGWQRLLDTLDTRDAIQQATDAVDELKAAAVEAFSDPSKIAAYEEAVTNVIREIAALAETIKLTNEDQNKLLLLVDTGQLERAVGLLAIIKTGSARGLNISVGQAVQAVMENQAFLGTLGIPGRAMGGPVSPGTYVVGERGPELLTLGSGQTGYVTANSAIGGTTTINVYTSADPDGVVRALQQYNRLSGPIAVNTRPL